MTKSLWLAGSLVLLAAAVPRGAHAQDALSVAQRCAQLDQDPQFRPMLNEEVRENPLVVGTASAGFTMLNTRRGGFGAQGDEIGLGGNVHLEAEYGGMHPFWARASAEFVAAGRFGLHGELAVGLTARSYGVRFVPAGSQLVVGRNYASFSSWDNHCSLARFDFHGFTGLRWGTIFGRDLMDSSGSVLQSVPFEGWLAPQLGLTLHWRRPNGRTTDTTLAAMVDVINGGSWGMYLRSYSTFSYFLFGADFGFFLPFDNTTTATHQPWDMFWLSANIGVHFEL